MKSITVRTKDTEIQFSDTMKRGASLALTQFCNGDMIHAYSYNGSDSFEYYIPFHAVTCINVESIPESAAPADTNCGGVAECDGSYSLIGTDEWANDIPQEGRQNFPYNMTYYLVEIVDSDQVPVTDYTLTSSSPDITITDEGTDEDGHHRYTIGGAGDTTLTFTIPGKSCVITQDISISI